MHPRGTTKTTLMIAVALLAGASGAAPAHAHAPGDVVAFRWEDQAQEGTYQIDPDGVAEKRKLSNGTPYFQTAATEAAISPSGLRVAYTGGHPHRNNAFVSDLVTGARRQLTFGDRWVEHPSWSPDGRMIAADCGRQICKVRTEGARRLRAVTHNRYREREPEWSPDGTRIVFASRRGLISIRPNGRGAKRLTRARVDSAPTWSPDSSQILFTRERGGRGTLFVMNRNGSGRTRLTDEAAFDREAEWSPDGTRIVFVRTTEAREEDVDTEEDLCSSVWTIGADGNGATRLTGCFAHTGFAAYYPVWSPDGERIAYKSQRQLPRGEGTVEDVVSVDAGGGDVRNLTNESEAGVRYFGLDW